MKNMNKSIFFRLFDLDALSFLNPLIYERKTNSYNCCKGKPKFNWPIIPICTYNLFLNEGVEAIIHDAKESSDGDSWEFTSRSFVQDIARQKRSDPDNEWHHRICNYYVKLLSYIQKVYWWWDYQRAEEKNFPNFIEIALVDDLIK